MTAGRWLCNACGLRFSTPDLSLIEAPLPLVKHEDDPSLPRSQVVKYFCPTCGSDQLAGAAHSSDPFMPKPATRSKP